MNEVQLTGRLVKDPVIQKIQENQVANFVLAVSDKNQNNKTSFIDCSCWGVKVNFIEKYLQKGSKINVTGKLIQDTYKDKDDNQRNRVYVLIRDIDYLANTKSEINNEILKKIE